MPRTRGDCQKEMFEETIRKEIEKIATPVLALAYSEMKGQIYDHISVLAIAKDFDKGIKRVFLTYDSVNIDLFFVDKVLFESDVKNSELLEAAAGRLILPYLATENSAYLNPWRQLFLQKKVMESLTSLALEHPQLSSEIMIDPKYFLHDHLLRLSHLLPWAYELLRFKEDENKLLLESYIDALKELESAGIIRIKNDLVEVERNFIEDVLKQGVSVSDQLNKVQKNVRKLLKLGVSGIIDIIPPSMSLSIVKNILSSRLKTSDLIQPDKFLYFPTAEGWIPLTQQTGFENILAGVDLQKGFSDMQLQRLGGALNEVYLVTYKVQGSTRKATLKRYPNWVSLKWAPIALWTLGTQNFAVLGKSRMERECATASYLIRSGVQVPKIITLSFDNRLIVRQYLDGENLVNVVKTIIQGKPYSEQDLNNLKTAGQTVAKIHGLGVTLGDCKPENFILSDNLLYIVDLEQGNRDGNKVWDIAEFLYFSGHHARPTDSLSNITQIVRSFMEGYIKGGGNRFLLTEASRLKYAKVFTILTLPQVIYTISKTLKSNIS